MTLTQKIENYLNLIVINLKLNTLAYLLFSIVFLCILPIVQGVSNLNKTATALCLENFVAIIGIILLVPIFSPEESKEIDEVVSSKSISTFKPYAVRTVLASISILVLVSGFCTMLRYNSCIFPFIPYIFGTFISAIFLGSIGMFASSLLGSTIVGYMTSIWYLIINMMTGNKYVGDFYILSMKNNSFNEKYHLLFGCVVFIALSIIIKIIRRKF